MSSAYDVFLASLDDPASLAWRADGAAEGLFADCLARAVGAEPALSSDTTAIVRAMARSVMKRGATRQALEETYIEDLACAVAAASGDRGAIERVDALVQSAARAVGRTMKLSGAETDEVAQVARVKLLVTGGAEPVLLRYSASGPLRSWMASLVGQEALRIVKAGARESPTEDLSELLIEHVASSSLGGAFPEEFRAAFHVALAALEVRDRNVLKLTVVDGLSAAEIAAGYRVHRVTVARWLRRIRDHLLSETKAQLALSSSDLIAAHLGDLDVSLTRLLRDDLAKPSER